MKEEIRHDLAQAAGRMHYFKNNQYNPNPSETMTGEELVQHMLADFNGRFANITLYPNWSQGDVVGMDMDLLHEGKRYPLRLMTQNPKKRNNKDQRYLSEYAKLAQQGHEVTWVTMRDGKDLKWLGKVVDGQYIPNGENREIRVEPAQTNTTNTHTTMGHYIAQLTKELPTIPQEHILNMVAVAGKMGMLK